MPKSRLVERQKCRDKLVAQLKLHAIKAHDPGGCELAEFVLSVLCDVVGTNLVKAEITDMELYFP